MFYFRKILAAHLVVLTLPCLAHASKSHFVSKDQSLYSIASKYHVSVDELKSVNSFTGSHADKGASIIIPSHAGKLKTISIVARQESYKVVKGDSLPLVAKKTGVKMSVIRKLNGLKGNKVHAGQVLALVEAPAKTVADPQVATNRLQLVNKDLLNEQELAATLAELTDIDPEEPVNLTKKLEEDKTISGLKKTAYSFLGAKYRFGGASRNALDCSSFTQQVFREQNIKLPRTAREQFSVGNEVSHGLKKGDLVFFQTYANFPSHVGIYLGDRKMIHASSRENHVVISSMDTPYYLSRYLGARRLADTAAENINFDELLLGIEEENSEDVLGDGAIAGVSFNLD